MATARDLRSYVRALEMLSTIRVAKAQRELKLAITVRNNKKSFLK